MEPEAGRLHVVSAQLLGKEEGKTKDGRKVSKRLRF
jgi:hypothetical protein